MSRQRLRPLTDSQMIREILKVEPLLVAVHQKPCYDSQFKREQLLGSIAYYWPTRSNECPPESSPSRCFVFTVLPGLVIGIYLWSRWLAIPIEPLFHPYFQLSWTESVVSPLNFPPSVDLALTNESTNVPGAISKEVCNLLYTPGTLFMF